MPGKGQHTVDGSEFLHHLGCIKPYMNTGISTAYQLVNAGFQPSTVSLRICELQIKFLRLSTP